MTHYSSQVIQALSQQVGALRPLRISFQQLQNYHVKLLQDFKSLAKLDDLSESQRRQQMQYLQKLYYSLDKQMSEQKQRLRQAQIVYARSQMERGEQEAKLQSLKGKMQLQIKSQKHYDNKNKQLRTMIVQIEFNISKYKQMIHNLQITRKAKEYQNVEIQRQIKKIQMINKRMLQLNHQTQNQIDISNHKIDQDHLKIADLQNKIDTYDKIIQLKQKQNKQAVNFLINKTKQLQELIHRKQYMEKLLESQNAQKQQLMHENGVMEANLMSKEQKLNILLRQNEQYSLMVNQERIKKSKHQQQIISLKNYLNTLVSTNQILFKQLQNSCAKDRQVQLLLTQKLEKLVIVNDKIRQGEILNRFDMNKIRQCSSKSQKKTSQSFSKYLSSTKGSKLKQNY